MQDGQAEPGPSGDERTDGRDRIAEEMRALAQALAYRLEEMLLSLGCEAHRDAAGSDRECAEGERAGAASACPLCALLAAVRGQWPSNSTRLLDQLASLLSTLRHLLAERSAERAEDRQPASEAVREERAHGEAGDASERDSYVAGPGKVQHIEVRRVRGRVHADVASGSGQPRETGEHPGGSDTEMASASC